MTLNLLYSVAVTTSKWSRCWTPRVEPQAGHVLSNNNTERHMDLPLSKKLAGRNKRVGSNATNPIK